MTILLERFGLAVWRASWEGAILALVIVLLLRVLGERLPPKWRYLLWSVVVVRFLVVAAPAAPWSAFNLIPWAQEAGAAHAVVDDARPRTMLDSQDTGREVQEVVSQPGTAIDPPAPQVSALPADSPDKPPSSTAAASMPAQTATESASSLSGAVRALFSTRGLISIWLAGCLVFGLQLAKAAIGLRRHFAACRPVTDAAILALLEAACLRIGRKRLPRLFVTPESISPCIAGTWNPRIIVPEAIVTATSTHALRHVLAHELAHLARGDLWTNWLLLFTRVVHWFNPTAWWTIRAMQAEREAACDELALATLSEADRPAYVATIIELATNNAPSAMAPAMIGLVSSARRLKVRVERLAEAPSVTSIRAPFAAACLLAIALAGLTDAMPGAEAQTPKKAAPKEEVPPKAKTHTESGRCVNHPDGAALAGISVRLYRLGGRTSPPVEIARTVTDADGRYAFPCLESPRPESPVDRLVYGVFGFAKDRPIGMRFFHIREGKRVATIRMTTETATLSGWVIDAAGQPVGGATVLPCHIYDSRVPDLLSATTDDDGRFKIDNVPVYKTPDGKGWGNTLTVLHPNYPATNGQVNELLADVVVTLPIGCSITGTIADNITGKPAGAIEVVATDENGAETVAATSAAGRFRMVVTEGRYSFRVHTKERVCIPLTDRECLAGEKLVLPQLKLIAGGFISGRVIDTSTGKPVVTGNGGEAVAIGLYGPSEPQGKVISPVRLASVDEAGRFTMRAAPGENFPYLVNTRGNRMAWDTLNQPPVVVNEGETTTYDMLITPPIPPAEKLATARKLVDSLPRQPNERANRIILEFRRLSHTVDETELWCTLMRELVAIGPGAVPQLCAELDRASEDRALRRLAFALRAIDDPRAVPALIRALPKTLLPSSSDYGLIVDDKDLTAFMQKHDLDPGAGGTYFGVGRPVREVCGALAKLTGQTTDDAELFGIHLSEDPRRQAGQRRFFERKAQRWQFWWEAHWRGLTNDGAYQKVNLNVTDDARAAPPKAPGPNARLVGETIGDTLSPAIQEGQHARHFYDLDTGFQPKWPVQIPRDESRFDDKPLADWAAENGVDLMCITHRDAEGTETFVLRSFGMKVWEISARDLRNLETLIAAGKLPEGREVGELLMHYDPETQQYEPDADAAFLFVTREGNMGLIETTDRVTKTANLNGLAGSPPRGVGFFKGVRFNLKSIIP